MFAENITSPVEDVRLAQNGDASRPSDPAEPARLRFADIEYG